MHLDYKHLLSNWLFWVSLLGIVNGLDEILFGRGRRRLRSFTTTNSAARGHLESLRYAHEHGAPWHAFVTSYAAEGHIECLRYCHEHGAAWSPSVLTVAAQGHLECLEYAHTHGAQWESCTTAIAARGHIECLAYCFENGAPISRSVTGFAAHGHLECLVYAHLHGAMWTGEATLFAALGNIACLKYAHENGAPWSQSSVSYAVSDGYLDCLKYCIENEAPREWESCRHFHQGQLECIEYLHQQGVVIPFDTAIQAARAGLTDCLGSLIRIGCLLNADRGWIKCNSCIISKAMARQRAASVIQRAWRMLQAIKIELRKKAVSVIQDAYIDWSCRPGKGRWYKNALESFTSRHQFILTE